MTEDGAAERELSYEEARDELLSVVQRLEAGGVPLQESVTLWERGEQLANICQRWLDGARARLDTVTRNEDHAVTRTQDQAVTRTEDH